MSDENLSTPPDLTAGALLRLLVDAYYSNDRARRKEATLALADVLEEAGLPEAAAKVRKRDGERTVYVAPAEDEAVFDDYTASVGSHDERIAGMIEEFEFETVDEAEAFVDGLTRGDVTDFYDVDMDRRAVVSVLEEGVRQIGAREFVEGELDEEEAQPASPWSQYVPPENLDQSNWLEPGEREGPGY
jgi:hypothetical protein